MVPKLGLHTYDLFYDKPDKILFGTIEISSSDPHFHFRDKTFLKFKDFLKGIDLSMHTQTKRVFNFSKNIDLTLLEIYVLKSEIIACNQLGAKELIVHLKNGKLNKKEIKIFKEVLDFAKKRKVEIIYESNSEFDGKACIDFFKKFPKVKYNLDLGHLNLGITKGTLGFKLEDFIALIKDKVVYIHAHNNAGERDEHKSLDVGTLDWKYILNMLDLSKVRKIIIEAKSTEDILKTKILLENYLKKK